MAKKDKEKKEPPMEAAPAEETEIESREAGLEAGSDATPDTSPEAGEAPQVDPWEEKYNAEHDARIRLAAEYDNFRKRTIKEKDASYGNGKSDAVTKMLPIYDNLERALNQPTEDAAYKKGVEMTLNELVKILNNLGVEIFGQPGDAFDPNLHNAVMHTENEELGENVVAQVFQKGFKLGEKVVRFAMVQVAN